MELSLEKIKSKFINYWVGVKEKVKNFYYDFPNLARQFWNKLKVNNTFQLTCILLVMCVICFGYSLVTNAFTTPFGGDFTLQGMTFIYNGYDDWKEFFRTGIFPTWDTSGFLGVNNIAANSFYYLFDPFFLLLLLFPRSFLLQAQTIIMFVKIILAGIFFYKFLGEFKMKETTRKIGAMAYAFSGWTMFYLWFFHFQEIATIFPLMLLGVEKVIKKRDPRVLIAGLTLMALVNYFFFFSMTVLAFLYAIFRWLQTWKTRTLDENYAALGSGFLGFFSGVLISGFILVPCVLMDLNMPRFANSSYLEDLFGQEGIFAKLKYMFVWPERTEYHLIYPLVSLFFMNDSCFEEALFNTNGYDNVSSSIYIFAPLTLLIVPSIVDACKKKEWGQLIGFALVSFMLFTPFTYYLLHAFAQAYGRWELFIVALLIVFVTTHFDDIKEMKRYVLDMSFVIVVSMMAVCTVLALQYAEGSYSALKPLDKMQKYIIPFQFIWVTLCYLFMRFRMAKQTFNRELLLLVGVEACIMGNLTVEGQGTVSYDRVHGGMKLAREQTRLVEALNKYDDSFFRIFNTQADRGNTNLSMFEGYNGVASFHSVYNFDSKDFIDWSRVAYGYNNWSMGNHEKRYNLDTLMGVKYYLLKKDDVNIPYGYVEVGTLEDCPKELKDTLYPYNKDSNFKLYLNENFIDTFFVYDKFISSKNFSTSFSEDDNEVNYLKAAIIDDEFLKAEDGDRIESVYDEYDRTSMSKINVYTSDLTYYRTNWDSKEEGGKYRTYNAYYNDDLYIKENPEAYDPNINRFNTAENFFIYPSDTVGKYGDVVDYHNGRQTKSENDNERGQIQNKMTFNSKVVYDASSPIAKDATSENGAYISIACPMDYNVDLYLYGKEGSNYKLLTHDKHMHNGYAKSSYTWKKARGFYVNEPVYRVVAVMKDDMKNASYNFDNPFRQIRYEYNTEFQNDIDTLKTNGSKLNISYRDNNEIRFTTNFDKDMFVVTNIPYDKGWKVSYEEKNEEETKNIDVPVFKAQGGFVGFIANEGQDVYYTLKYEVPGLGFGKILTLGGLTLASCLYAIYISNSNYVKMMRKIKEATSLS